jgi:hypothetical protein
VTLGIYYIFWFGIRNSEGAVPRRRFSTFSHERASPRALEATAKGRRATDAVKPLDLQRREGEPSRA